MRRRIESIILGSFILSMAGCSRHENGLKIKEFGEKTAALELEATRLAHEVAEVQSSIKAMGREEESSDAVQVGLEVQLSGKLGEFKQRQETAAGLTSAIDQLTKQRAEYTQRYVKP